jgi:hypothetical protein
MSAFYSEVVILIHPMMKKNLFVIGLLLSARIIHAQAWTNMGIGAGGAQYAPSFSYLDPNLVFLQCDMGGIYRSDNNATSFQIRPFTQFGSDTDYPNGSCPIGYDPNNVNNLWGFGVENDDVNGSLLYSSDEGNTWAYAPSQPAWGNNTRITRIVVDRGNSDFIVLGADSGAYYSTNGGTSWITCSGVDGYVWDIVIDQSSPVGNRTVYIGTDVDAYAGTGGGVFKGTSVNTGGTFAAANTGLPTPAALTGFSGASTSSPATVVLYAVYDSGGGTYNGTDIYTSVNGAANWTLSLSGTTTGADGFNKVECSEGSPATAYAINNSQNATEGVWQTTNYGATWNNVFTPSTSGGNVTLGWIDYDILFQEGAAWIQLKVDPVNPNRVVATDLDCSYMTTNGGTTWNEIYSDFADTAPIGPGKKWTTLGLEVTTAWHYYICPWLTTTHYIAQSDIGLQRSTDSGATWYHSLPFSTIWHNTIFEMAFNSATSVIYAAASDQHDIPHSTQIGTNVTLEGGGVLQSANNGVTWESVSTGLPTIPATSILRDPTTGNLYVAMWGNATAGTQGGVYMSANSGASWTVMNTGLGNSPNYHAYQLKEDSAGDLFCLISGYLNDSTGTWTPGGIWKYPKGGTTWTYLTGTADTGNGNAPLYYLQGFDVDSTGATIYAASMKWGTPTQKGMYLSVNGGTSWTHPISTFPGTVNPIDGFCPSINPNNSSDVYLGTEDEGLWESLNAGTSWTQITGVPFRSTHRVYFDTASGNRYLTTFGNSVWMLPGSVTPTATSTPTITSNATSTLTRTPTATATLTATSTSTVTSTSTSSATPTFTLLNAFTPTLTPTNTATASQTTTRSFTSTGTPSNTLTSTPTFSLTLTPVFSYTSTPTGTATSTLTNSFTATITATLTITWTPAPSNTFTLSPTAAFTMTPTMTFIFTATPIPTPTGSHTHTFTATTSPTSIHTLGPSSAGTVVIYPNPVAGPGPDQVQLTLGQPASTVDFSLFTTAFRKVNELSYSNLPAGTATLALPLTYRDGVPLANGLYYLVVKTPQGRSLGKLVILR